MTDVPLDPVGAAMHAVVVQGGYSTPEIEAYRILTDALRQADHGPLDKEWAQGVTNTLAWIDSHPSAALDRQRQAFERHAPEAWRRTLVAAADLRSDAEPVAGPAKARATGGSS